MTVVVVLVAILIATLLQLCNAAHPCSLHLSSCRNCLGDTANACQFCRTSSGLGQCIPPGDSLITTCQMFESTNVTKLITALSQCPATGSAAENCAVHSTNNQINCNSCVRDTTNSCSWCGTASTGSCHATSGTSASFLCGLLLRGQLITAASVTANASLANQCPTGSTPNYCPTYLGCSACQADPDCAFCISFDDSCFREGRCVSKSDRQAVCTNNADLKRPYIIGPAPDLDVTCANVPTSCSDLDAIVGTSGGGGGTSGPTSSGGPAGGSTTGGGTNASGGGGGTTATLPSACDDIAILDKCVTQCGTGSNVDQCKCVNGAESITCKDMQTITVPATSSTSSLMISFAGVALSALLAVLLAQ